MGIRWFLKNVCADVGLYMFHYFCIQETHGLLRYFMGECNGLFNTTEALYKDRFFCTDQIANSLNRAGAD